MRGSLDGYYVGSLQSFGALLDGELNLLVLFQTLVAFHLESREVYKNILSALAADESESLGGIEPLDGTNITFF
jgi:hypothetical protein